MANAGGALSAVSDLRSRGSGVPRPTTLATQASGDRTLTTLREEAEPLSQAASRHSAPLANTPGDEANKTDEPATEDTTAASTRPVGVSETQPRAFDYPTLQSGFEVALGPLK